jgi:predicted kinase
MNEKRVYLMVGVSGSGKSTAAKKLAEEIPDTVIVSADHHMVDATGKWSFDPTRLSVCHATCQERFHDAIKRGVSTIIVDNTNLISEHRAVYTDHALQNGYSVTLLVFDIDIETALKRNVHGVPRHTLEAQHRKLDLKPGIYQITYDPVAAA